MLNKFFHREKKVQEVPVVTKEQNKLEKADAGTTMVVGGIGIVLSMFIFPCAAPFFTTTMASEANKTPQVQVTYIQPQPLPQPQLMPQPQQNRCPKMSM